MSSAFVHLLASHKPRAHSLPSFGAGDAGMHTKDAKSKSQQKCRHDQINVVFDSLRHKYGMRIDRAEVRLEADACSEAAYRGLHGHTAQLDAPDTSTGMYTGCSSTCDGRDDSATGIRGTQVSKKQEANALDVREYTCSDAAKLANLSVLVKEMPATEARAEDTLVEEAACASHGGCLSVPNLHHLSSVCCRSSAVLS
jgi:hypothetical protein